MLSSLSQSIAERRWLRQGLYRCCLFAWSVRNKRCDRDICLDSTAERL